MVERSLSMREVPGSMPGFSNVILYEGIIIIFTSVHFNLQYGILSGWPSGLRRQTQD